MRVLMVSTSFPSDASDWRGLFIRHLVDAFSRAGDVELSLWAPPGELPSNVKPVTTPTEGAWLHGLMQDGGISHLMRRGGVSGVLAPIRLLRSLRAVYRRQLNVDVYHVNWLQCALPLPGNRVPALISVLGNDMKLLRLPLVKSLMRRAMRGRRVAICPNAPWMQPLLEAAFSGLADVLPVSFGIDPRWYAVERQPDTEKPIWLAITRLTADKLGPLFEWSESLFKTGKRELHLFGPAQEKTDIPDWVRYHGAATPAQLCESWFPRASGLITLSRHAEGRPQVMLEAMASGLPIVASSNPAHASIIAHGRNGLLCSTQEGYAEAIESVEDPVTGARLAEAGREYARAEFGTWDDCVNRYRKIYERLLFPERSGA